MTASPGGISANSYFSDLLTDGNMITDFDKRFFIEVRI